MIIFCAILMGFTGCRKSHASAKQPFTLTLSSAGGKPAHLMSYRLPSEGWGRYRLDIKATSRGVKVTGKTRLLIQILSKGTLGDQLRLEVEVLDVAGSDPGSAATVDRAQRIIWTVNPNGHTERQVNELSPTLIQGLPDLGLLLSRMLPVLPSEPVGKDARWTIKRPLRLDLPNGSGTGGQDVFEQIQYHLVKLEPSSPKPRAEITAAIQARYDGHMSPVARKLRVQGQGKGVLKAAVDLASGRLLEARLDLTDEITLQTSDRINKLVYTIEATLQPASPSLLR